MYLAKADGQESLVLAILKSTRNIYRDIWLQDGLSDLPVAHRPQPDTPTQYDW